MSKLALGAIAAAVTIVGALSVPAEAAFTPPRPSPPPPPPPPSSSAPSTPTSTPTSNPGDGPGVGCVVLCVSIPVHRRIVAKEDACTDHLAQLRHVTAAEIAEVDAQDVVHIVPLCDSLNRSLTQGHEARVNVGNVQGLLPAITSNAVLNEGLTKSGYHTRDVLGIAFGPNAAVLYVSHR